MKTYTISLSNFKAALTFVLLTIYNPMVYAISGPSTRSANADRDLSAACVTPSGATELRLNNVRALIHTGGDMWEDFATSVSAYEIPKGSGRTSLYSGSLWLGGVDDNGALKIAAQRFRSDGTDYWTGPLTKIGASVDASVCAEYDKHFKITRMEVEQFIGWFSLKNDPVTQSMAFPGYVVPESIKKWPAHGDVSLGQEYYLAPFYDLNGNGFYDPEAGGDYPFYDVKGSVDCKTDRRSVLYGDETLWWVFNDKGNIHTQTGAGAMGMEIRAQAFAFSTNNEINNMTFYNYELINRASYDLNNTYFGQWADADLGYSDDDYVGCDVGRGLGYCYNGDGADGPGQGAYDGNPPAVGIDFFEGPYQDKDSIDNAYGIGPGEALNGIGYGDTIVDNERFGMRRFVYHNRSTGNPATQDPDDGSDYYNYLRSIWKDGTKMLYGGTGHISGSSGLETDFMFPGDSDPLNWGTQGQAPGPIWTEETAGNLPGDRRFIQSAGPFKLEAGAVNDITVGVPWAKATNGGPFNSVSLLRVVDDKAQALFDACFKILNGPDAPDLAIQELNGEIILTLNNPITSNNYLENYKEIDAINIPKPFTKITTEYLENPPGSGNYIQQNDTVLVSYDRNYRFQGYQIFQLKDNTVSAADLSNVDMARLVAQCDMKDTVAQIVNYIKNDITGGNDPIEKVAGSNLGIQHSFSVTTDLFAQGNKTLVNHKQYYFMAIAYGFNEFKKYDPNDPEKLDGQKVPYIASRKGAAGPIRLYTGIPHIPTVEANGTILNAAYGSGPKITRIEGQGNGGLVLDLTQETVDAILNSPDHMVREITYQGGKGPINVKVIDPLNVTKNTFTLKMIDTIPLPANNISDAYWVLTDSASGQETYSHKLVTVSNEQLLPEYGISITVGQSFDPGAVDDNDDKYPGNGFLEASVEYADSSKRWLLGVPDIDIPGAQNWIRSGTTNDITTNVFDDFVGQDDMQDFEKILGGTIAPYRLVADVPFPDSMRAAPALSTSHGLSLLSYVSSVDLVITADKSKWTRCPVLEMGDSDRPTAGDVQKFRLRISPSVDKDGQPDNSGTRGMGWFPGYAINIETGERLNMMFSEDSWLAGENGNDMLWNPSANMYSLLGEPLFGGRHYIYVMNHNTENTNTGAVPRYDEGKFMYDLLSHDNVGNVNFNSHSVNLRKLFTNAMWVCVPLLAAEQEFLSTDVKIRLRVTKPYRKNYSTVDVATNANNGNVSSPQNNNNPMYKFSLFDLATVKGDNSTAEDALKLVNVVPNPYYAFSQYETGQVDNRIKIVNLPDECTVSIYSINGTLIRRYKKDSGDRTSIDWDLKNSAGIPISGGTYIIHVNAPGIGEKTVKWFGALRPIDLDTF